MQASQACCSERCHALILKFELLMLSGGIEGSFATCIGVRDGYRAVEKGECVHLGLTLGDLRKGWAGHGSQLWTGR